MVMPCLCYTVAQAGLNLITTTWSRSQATCTTALSQMSITASAWAVPLLLSSSAVIDVSEAADLPVGGDTLPGREGDVSGRAVALTEAALNASVHDGRCCWGGLQMLDVQIWILQPKSLVLSYRQRTARHELSSYIAWCHMCSHAVLSSINNAE